MKIPLDKIGQIIGIWLPLWGGLVFLFNYESSLVKTDQLAEMDLDARIARTEIVIAVYSINHNTLNEQAKNEYDRAKARLVSLEAQRDELLGRD